MKREFKLVRTMYLTVLAATFAIAIPVADGFAQTGAATIPERSAIERLVRDYLLRNPEIIEEALTALQAKKEAALEQRTRSAIIEHGEALRQHPVSPVSGNPHGDVTVVEFFDYQCGYCKRSLEVVMDLLKTDRQVRIVWKEFPILGPVSGFAARAAMAAKQQGEYLRFHVGVMSLPGRLTETAVMGVAKDIGLDVARLRRDMEDSAIDSYLEETAKLARAIGIRGTPAFVIGETLVPGAVDGARLRKIIAEARSGG